MRRTLLLGAWLVVAAWFAAILAAPEEMGTLRDLALASSEPGLALLLQARAP
ncbi:hypothetical protein [Rhodovarius crocodyli]|uniref:hypothetical protein n=1 Tax=Rhodovarius crocodyli TaxID=1979269 RepID=UPI0013E3DAC9|nr:hypothetical protein [Rhodovarius crocodyli]